MNKSQLELLKYLWVGFKLDGQNVVAPNGKVVTRVLDRTITELSHAKLIALDGTRYRLTDAGRARVLVKERVRKFCSTTAETSA